MCTKGGIKGIVQGVKGSFVRLLRVWVGGGWGWGG